jgi:hypothetical protein
VLAAIDFDDDLLLETNKIKNVAFNGRLATEFEGSKPAVT